VRKANQDNFLICSMRRKVDVHLSSLPSLDRLPLGAERVALLAMVADGSAAARWERRRAGWPSKR